MKSASGHYQVIVVGAGGMGSAAAFHLAPQTPSRARHRRVRAAARNGFVREILAGLTIDGATRRDTGLFSVPRVD
jgi:glycine/D-amino acid oxidase-like deaminating enzyme